MSHELYVFDKFNIQVNNLTQINELFVVGDPDLPVQHRQLVERSKELKALEVEGKAWMTQLLTCCPWHDGFAYRKSYCLMCTLKTSIYSWAECPPLSGALRQLSAAQAIATGSSHAASESANNANDVDHTNDDLHVVNPDNNQGSDNHGDDASIM